ncbi:hypothetical protein MD588_21955 [Photobacterium sp. SDRW27]|uniref:hypothetical protein n=1 Tax=Photobacterium obscurum TaxID=2829490 RepID=UPI0022431844|nr:hypothetical protein [Photobacterium obscurum]MCW8331463.1 hypothetical protein [Photobacterium obscurum]
MRPASSVRYVSTPRSPSRLRATSHAPTFKTKKAPLHTADVHTMPAPGPVIAEARSDNEQAA